MLYTSEQIDTKAIWEIYEIKNALRISHDHDDNLIAGFLNSAIDYLEKYTEILIYRRMINAKGKLRKNKLWLKYTPVHKIDKISFDDGTEMDKKDLFHDGQIIIFKDQFINKQITITYICGYGEAIPFTLKESLLRHIALMYDKPENSREIERDIKTHYLSYRNLKM